MVRQSCMPKKCQQAFTEYKRRIGDWVENNVVYDADSCLDGRIARNMATKELKSNVNSSVFGNFLHKMIGAESNRLGDELFYLHAALKKDLSKKPNSYKGAKATMLKIMMFNKPAKEVIANGKKSPAKKR